MNNIISIGATALKIRGENQLTLFQLDQVEGEGLWGGPAEVEVARAAVYKMRSKEARRRHRKYMSNLIGLALSIKSRGGISSDNLVYQDICNSFEDFK